MTTPTAAAIYTRISRDAAGLSLGVQRQETLCHELAERLGWTVADVYSDNDLSAYASKQRPAWQAMCRAIADGSIDGIIAVDQDRLTRQVRELEDVIDLGVPVALSSGELDLTSSDGRMVARMMGVMARQESEKKSERIIRERAQRAAQGRPNPGPRSFGFRSWRMDPDPVEAPALADAARRVADGEASLAQIGREWNAAGLRTVNGNLWSTNAVRDALVRPANVGLRSVKEGRRHKVVAPGTWEPLFDRELYERLTVVVESRRRPGRPATALLSGLLRCGVCGASMVSGGPDKKGRSVYQCRRGRPAWPDACGRLTVDRTKTDALLSDEVEAALKSGAFRRALADAETPETDVRVLVGQLEDDEAKLDRLERDYYEDGLLDRGRFLKLRQTLVDRVERTRGSLARVSSVPASVPPEAWGGLPLDVRRQVVGLLVERVTCFPQVPGAPRRFDPSRLTIVWRV